MSKVKIDTFSAVAETMKALSGSGCLLVAGAERVNPMTIGWAEIGIVWGKPVFTVLVRPSRFTFGLMEEANEFSVNVPGEALADACMLCGTRSGRDIDKIAETGLTVEPGIGEGLGLRGRRLPHALLGRDRGRLQEGVAPLPRTSGDDRAAGPPYASAFFARSMSLTRMTRIPASAVPPLP
ncbi:MAG: flavin reductase family protein [Planctomycetota bacterium]|jgi:hypothetical protein